MEDKEQEKILQHQRKRKKRKIKLAVESIIIILIAITIITTYFVLTKNDYNNYTEKANVDYIVNLEENEFYEENYVDEKTSVVASLIRDIEVEFNYNLQLEQEQEYTYYYKILATINVKESSRSNSIYESQEELVNKEIQTSSAKNLEILEKVNINYNEYNEKMNRFINVYNLSNTTSTLELDMYVYVVNSYDGEQINKESKVMTLNIPLTTRTVDISLGTNVIEDQGQILSRKSEYEDLTYVLVIGIVLLLIGIATFIRFIKYVSDTRSAETMYKQELKRILFNYKAYIQTVNEAIDTSNYKVIEINTFNEILSMRDTIQSPILMHTEENEERTRFMIINNDMLFVYILGAKEIRNDLRIKHAIKVLNEEAKKKNKENKQK